MPFIDLEKLQEIYFSPAKLCAIHRLVQQRLENDIAGQNLLWTDISRGYGALFQIPGRSMPRPSFAHT